MSDIDARLARVLANIARPGPIDDSHVYRDREGWPGQDAADRMADDAADQYEKEMDDRWE